MLSDTTITQASGEMFTVLYAAPSDVNIRGVSFAPVPEPSTWALMLVGFAGLGFAAFRHGPGRAAALASARGRRVLKS